MRGLFFILFCLGCGLSRGEAEGETVPAIRVTHRWGDLFNTQQVAVVSDRVIFPDRKLTVAGQPGQVNVWLGIDRDHATSHGAVLLYCAAKGASFVDVSDKESGLFEIIVHTPNRSSVADPAKQLFMAPAPHEQLHDSTFTLSARTVPLGGPGEYVIELLQRYKADPNAAPKVVAKATVEVAGETALPWSPWDYSDKKDEHPLARETNNSVYAMVRNPLNGVAVPTPPQEPIFYQEAPNENTPLPILLPNQPDAETVLKMVGNTLIFTGANINWHKPEDHFLARWWINDKPWVSEAKAPQIFSMSNDSGLKVMGTPAAAYLELDFHPENMRAKKGDKIGVQLLNCPGGYQLTGAEAPIFSRDSMPLMAPFPLTSLSSMSNRIDFVYSGDPDNLRQ